jgi:hypothetical protein
MPCITITFLSVHYYYLLRNRTSYLKSHCRRRLDGACKFGNLKFALSESLYESGSVSAAEPQSAARKATQNRSWRSVLVATVLLPRPRTSRGTGLNNNTACWTSRADEKPGLFRDCSQDSRSP